MRNCIGKRLLPFIIAVALLAGCGDSGEFRPKYTTSFEPYDIHVHDIEFYMPFEGGVELGDVTQIDTTITQEAKQLYAYYANGIRGDRDWFWFVGYYEAGEDLVNIGEFDFQQASDVVMYMMGKKVDLFVQRHRNHYPTNLVYDVEDHVAEGYARVSGTFSMSTLDDTVQSEWPFVGFAALSDETAVVSLFFDLKDGENADLLNTYREEALNTLEVHGRKLLA